jgi:hypothetical protein
MIACSIGCCNQEKHAKRINSVAVLNNQRAFLAMLHMELWLVNRQAGVVPFLWPFAGELGQSRFKSTATGHLKSIESRGRVRIGWGAPDPRNKGQSVAGNRKPVIDVRRGSR